VPVVGLWTGDELLDECFVDVVDLLVLVLDGGHVLVLLEGCHVVLELELGDVDALGQVADQQ